MPFQLPDGSELNLHLGRCDERQRHLRHRLPKQPSLWDFAPLIDVLRREPGLKTFQFTGLTVQQWLDRLSGDTMAYHRFTDWVTVTLQTEIARDFLAKRPLVPDNHYCIELATPPLHSSLFDAIESLGLRQATVQHWLGNLRALSGKGIKPEELTESGVIQRLEILPANARLRVREVLERIHLNHVIPRFATESRFGYIAAAPWRSCCQRIPPSEYRRRGLIGKGKEALHIIRYRHPSLAWSIVRTRYQDLITPLSDWWSVIDERGKFIQQPWSGFDSPEAAMDYAEYCMSQQFASWGRSQPIPRWKHYALPGGDGYQEILLQLDNWVPTYHPRHYRTRNVLVHIRLSIRQTPEGQRVLFLDEVQSDWHADLHNANQNQPGHTAQVSSAPFRKEWPLLALKLMLWWAQRQNCQGLAWSTEELQDARWGEHSPPLLLYRKLLPEAAAALAKTLALNLGKTSLTVRNQRRNVKWTEEGWRVCNARGIPVTKSFRRLAQAEHFANLTGSFTEVTVPVLWIQQLGPIKSIPLYGLGAEQDWLVLSEVV